jgi:hypothetical protein
MASSDWTVWLTQKAGEVFMGLPISNGNNYRFCVRGKFVEHLAGVGVWIDVDSVQQVKLSNNAAEKTWTIKPHSCMIPWSYISYVQRGKHSGGIGFVETKRTTK